MTAKKQDIQADLEPVEPPKPKKPTTHTAVEGDTYASIAAQYCPAGHSKHAYATSLFALNKGALITAGKQIRL